MENGENKKQEEELQTEEQKAVAEQLRNAGIISEQAPPDAGLEIMPPERLSKEEIKTRENVAALKRMAEEHEKGSQGATEENISPETQATAQTEAEEKEPKAQELEKEKTLREKISELRSEIKAMVPETEEAKKKQEELKTLIAESKNLAYEFLSSPDITKENSRKLAESFRELTEKENEEPRNLEWESNKMAEKRLKADGMKIIKGPEAIKEYKDRLIKKEEIEIQQKERDRAVSTCWARLSEKEKAKFQSTDSAGFKDYIAGHARRLGVAEDVFYSLVGAGIIPEKTKKKGWFFKRIDIMDSRFPRPIPVSVEEFNRATAAIQNAQFERVAKFAEVRADSTITEGKRLLRITKRMCTENIVNQAVSGYEIEGLNRQLEAEREAATTAKEKKRNVRVKKPNTPARPRRYTKVKVERRTGNPIGRGRPRKMLENK